MAKWRIRWTCRGESVVEGKRKGDAERNFIDRFQEDGDLEIIQTEIEDGETPPEDLTCTLAFCGQEISVVYERGDGSDYKTMPTFGPLGTDEGWWTNGHVALRLDQAPPEEMSGWDARGSLKTMTDRAAAMAPVPECPKWQINEMYRPFAAAPGVEVVRLGPGTYGSRMTTEVGLYELRRDGAVVGWIMPKWVEVAQ